MKKFLLTGIALTSLFGVSLSGLSAAASAQNSTGLNPDMLCRVAGAYNVPAGPHYRAGVDVRGNAVTPADVNAPSPLRGAEMVRFPLTVDVAHRLGLIRPGEAQMEVYLGMIEIRPEGAVTYNGQDITGNVTNLCSALPPPKPEVSAPKPKKKKAAAPKKPAAPVEPAVEAPVEPAAEPAADLGNIDDPVTQTTPVPAVPEAPAPEVAPAPEPESVTEPAPAPVPAPEATAPVEPAPAPEAVPEVPADVVAPPQDPAAQVPALPDAGIPEVPADDITYTPAAP